MDKLRSMQVFREVVKHGSFSAAAESLQLVNSAVSRQVTELEQWLGIKLLYRTTRSLSLTNEGRSYLDKFEALLDDVGEIERLANVTRNEVTGSINITTFRFIGDTLLKPFLIDFLQRYPKVRVSIRLSEHRVDMIDEGFDLAIRVGMLRDSNLVARKIGKLTLRAVAAPSYLEQNGTPKTPIDLQQHNCLYDSILDRNNQRWLFKKKGQEYNVAVSGNLVVNGGEFIRDLTLQGLGIAYLPHFFVDDLISEGKLVEVLKTYKHDDYPLAAVYPQNRRMSLALRTFIDEFMDSQDS